MEYIFFYLSYNLLDLCKCDVNWQFVCDCEEIRGYFLKELQKVSFYNEIFRRKAVDQTLIFT